MKRNLSLTTLIITTLIIIVGIWGYYSIIRPMYLNNVAQSKEISLSKSKKIAFGKYENQKKVFGIEIEISGKTSSNFDLIISDTERDMNVASVKGGENVSFTYKAEWHSDSCYLHFSPRQKGNGKLNVECRFLAMD